MEKYKKLIGEKIRARRKQLGFKTQDSLALAVGVDASRISRWESGKNIPDPDFRSTLARVLQTDESLFDYSAPTMDSNKSKSELIASIVTGLSSLNEHELGAVLKIVSLSSPTAAKPRSSGT